MSLTLRINGEDRAIRSNPDTPLVYVLRDELKLKGTKLACGREQCGACMILADGAAVPSCVSPAGSFEGREIVTIEGIGDSDLGRRVQRAFVETTAAQCGYCTAGLVVAVTGLLSEEPAPSSERAKEALAPNLCRCGSHPRVLKAVELAASAR